jgi:hypothetical protein
MRSVFAAATLIVVTSAVPLWAEEMPWCVELDVFTKNCAFASHDECVAVANNAASPATGIGRCIRNPNYQPLQAAARAKPAADKAKKQR